MLSHKNANMRTSLDLPDPLFRHLKVQAALEGRSLRDLVVSLVERGLAAPPPASPQAPAIPAEPPSVRLGSPMALAPDRLSNASLSELLDG
jgi:plasmid stability protein